MAKQTLMSRLLQGLKGARQAVAENKAHSRILRVPRGVRASRQQPSTNLRPPRSETSKAEVPATIYNPLAKLTPRQRQEAGAARERQIMSLRSVPGPKDKAK